MEARIEQDRPKVRVGSNGTAAANYANSSIQLMRGADDPAPTDAEIVALAEAIAWLRKAGGWSPAILPHSHFVATSCPGDALRSRLGEIETLVKRIEAGESVDRDDPREPISASTYTVRPGDTLGAIAKRWGVSVDAIVAANPFVKDPDVISVGRVLKKPGAPAPAPKPPAPAPKPTRLYGRPAGTVWYQLLRWGVTDSDSVRNLQRRLLDLGYSIPAGPTGNYFAQTKAAVAAFQRRQGWSGSGADGYPGPETMKRLFVYRGSPYRIEWGKP
jgi:LysM repeat protein